MHPQILGNLDNRLAAVEAALLTVPNSPAIQTIIQNIVNQQFLSPNQGVVFVTPSTLASSTSTLAWTTSANLTANSVPVGAAAVILSTQISLQANSSMNVQVRKDGGGSAMTALNLHSATGNSSASTGFVICPISKSNTIDYQFTETGTTNSAVISVYGYISLIGVITVSGGGGGGSSTLAGLTDVSLSGLSDGQILQYVASASKWQNTTLSGDATISNSGALTFSTVNSNVGSFGTASSVGSFTVNGKGLVTAASNTSIAIAASQITSGTLALARGGTNADLSATGGTSQVLKQVSSGAAITVGQLAASDLSNGTTGSGSVVLATSPTLVTPLLGTPTSGTLTNCTGLPIGGVVGGTQGRIPYDNGTVGTWLATGTANQILTTGGASANPSYQNIASLLTQGTGITISGTTNATIAFANTATTGGTAQTTYATGDILYASGANTLAKLAIGSSGNFLKVSGGVPTWAAGGTTSPGGSDTQVQYNSSSAFAGSSVFTFDGTNVGVNAPSVIRGQLMSGHAAAVSATYVPSGTKFLYTGVSGIYYNAGVVVSNTTTDRATFAGIKGSGTATNTLGAVASGDQLASFQGLGCDGTSILNMAGMNVLVDGSVSTGNIPTGLGFYSGVTAGGAAYRLKIMSAGNVLSNGGLGLIATGETDKFLYIPYGTATPTGTPTAYTGNAAFQCTNISSVYKLWVYIPSVGWKSVAVT